MDGVDYRRLMPILVFFIVGFLQGGLIATTLWWRWYRKNIIDVVSNFVSQMETNSTTAASINYRIPAHQLVSAEVKENLKIKESIPPVKQIAASYSPNPREPSLSLLSSNLIVVASPESLSIKYMKDPKIQELDSSFNKLVAETPELHFTLPAKLLAIPYFWLQLPNYEFKVISPDEFLGKKAWGRKEIVSKVGPYIAKGSVFEASPTRLVLKVSRIECDVADKREWFIEIRGGGCTLPDNIEYATISERLGMLALMADFHKEYFPCQKRKSIGGMLWLATKKL